MRVLILAVGFGTISIAAYCQQQPIQQAAKAIDQKTPSEDIPKVTGEQTISFWMAKKLELSKAILESLTKGDFDTLAKDAEQMRKLGKLEGFVRRNKEYQTQLHSFELANKELVRHSLRRNVEGATLAFNQLTTSCVSCHTLLREGIE